MLVVLHMRHRPSVRLWALEINRCGLVGSQRAKNGTGVLKINAHLQPMCLSHPRLPNFNVDLNVPHGGGAHRFIKNAQTFLLRHTPNIVNAELGVAGVVGAIYDLFVGWAFIFKTPDSRKQHSHAEFRCLHWSSS